LRGDLEVDSTRNPRTAPAPTPLSLTVDSVGTPNANYQSLLHSFSASTDRRAHVRTRGASMRPAHRLETLLFVTLCGVAATSIAVCAWGIPAPASRQVPACLRKRERSDDAEVDRINARDCELDSICPRARMDVLRRTLCVEGVGRRGQRDGRLRRAAISRWATGMAGESDGPSRRDRRGRGVAMSWHDRGVRSMRTRCLPVPAEASAMQCGLRVGSFGCPISPVEPPSPVKVKRVESTEWVCMRSRRHSHGETGPTCSAGLSAKAKDTGAGVPAPLESLLVSGAFFKGED